MGFLLSAISLGFLGSFHCIGMCGPIAMALPIGKAGITKRLFLILTYNLGRILTYSVLGLIFGLIGQGFFIGGYQQLVSITIGSILLISVVLPANFTRQFRLTSFANRLLHNIKSSLGKLFLKTGHRSFLLIGILNGLLPCGLVYIGIAGAVATGNSLNGALFMALFGAGTVPVMLGMPFFGNLISMPFRNNIRRTVPLLVGTMAVLLILRGLNLGIPFVSPKMDTVSLTNCHSSDGSKTPYSKKTILCSGPGSVHKK